MDKATKKILVQTIKDLKEAKINGTFEQEINRYKQNRNIGFGLIIHGEITENDYCWIAFKIMDRYLRIFGSKL